MSTTEMWSVKVYDENPVHTWLKVYNYGGLAGTLCVNTGDAPELVARLTTHMRSENVKLRMENNQLRGQRDAAVAIAIRTQQERYALHDALEEAVATLIWASGAFQSAEEGDCWARVGRPVLERCIAAIKQTEGSEP